MTDMTAFIWVVRITCWLLIGIPTTYFMMKAKQREDPTVSDYISPGVACVLMPTKQQIAILVAWIDAEDDAPRSLQSFRRQVLRATPVNGVPVYHGQVNAVSEMLERRGCVHVAKEIRGT